MAVLEGGNEDPGEIADGLRMKIVMLHEPFDASAAGPVLIAEAGGDLALEVERQPVVGTAGEVMDMAAHRAEEAFGSLDPVTAQYEMSVEKFVEIFAPLKPKFIHHAESKRLIKEMLIDFGCDPETTYLDVPRLRAVLEEFGLAALLETRFKLPSTGSEPATAGS